MSWSHDKSLFSLFFLLWHSCSKQSCTDVACFSVCDSDVIRSIPVQHHADLHVLMCNKSCGKESDTSSVLSPGYECRRLVLLSYILYI